MELYKEPGQSGRLYCVFPKKYDKAKAIEEAARHCKVSKARMKIITVYADNEELAFEPTKGKVEKIAVIRERQQL